MVICGSVQNVIQFNKTKLNELKRMNSILIIIIVYSLFINHYGKQISPWKNL